MTYPSPHLVLAASLVLVGCYSGAPEATAGSEEGSGTTAESGTADSGGGEVGSGELGEEVVGPVTPEPLHRLNQLEYNNTVRDLLGVTLTPADNFPPDAATEGFDNLADGLTLTPTLMDLYSLAARELAGASLTIVPRYAANFAARAHAEATGQGGTAFDWGWSMLRGGGGALSFAIEVPQAETVTWTVVAGGDAFGEPTPEMGLLLDGVEIGHWVVTSLPTAPAPYSVATALAPGPHTVTVTFPNGADQPAENIFNSLVIGSLAITSDALTEPPGRALIYVCDPVEAVVPDDCYRTIVTNFAGRAWRRPLTDVEATQVFALWQQLSAAEGPEAAVMLTVRAMLLSAKFLYRPSLAGAPGPDTPQGLAPLDDYALASRLSYFIWSSMPDEELMTAAAAGLLRDEAGLREQVARMLVDPKADGLRRGFASQWLATRNFARHSPDAAAFPTFDEPLRAAMIAESELFFKEFLTNKLPVEKMFDPDFGFLNDRLAQHYGLPLPGTAEMRRVALARDQRRGLTLLGAWLTATSASNRTSPVNRGRFILEQMLCTPIPPPPPDIPPLMEPAEGDTIREILAKHRENAACAGCHNLLDPAGLGMEGYDGVGARRDLEYGVPVDESGAIPTDVPFVGATELAEILADDPRFAACLTDKLFTYALGRKKVPFDWPFAEEISEALPEQGGSLDKLIELIALSPAFRMRPEKVE